MTHFRLTFAASIAVTFFMVVSWGIAIAGMWQDALPPRAMAVNLGAAVALLPTCTFLWATLLLRSRLPDVLRDLPDARDRVALYLADAVVASRRAALRTTQPLRVLRDQ
jgi:hypothetical protein